MKITSLVVCCFFTRSCISRFKECPLCGADIERIEPDENLQSTVDRFIEGHARIKRPQVNTDSHEVPSETKTVIYEDVSLDRGAFLVQQAMRVSVAWGHEIDESHLRVSSDEHKFLTPEPF